MNVQNIAQRTLKEFGNPFHCSLNDHEILRKVKLSSVKVSGGTCTRREKDSSDWEALLSKIFYWFQRNCVDFLYVASSCMCYLIVFKTSTKA